MGRDASGERELQEKSASAERAGALEGDNLALIAAGVAHDLNNLLTISLGVADLAAEQLPADSAIRPYLNEIVAANRHAADLARQLLVATRRVSSALVPVDVNAVLASMESLLRTALPRDARLECALWEGALWVEGDAIQLRQVVLNLITNAGEAIAGEHGVARVTTSRARRPHTSQESINSDWAVIEVRDNGCGLDEETLRHIFEPRFTTKSTGHGMGLAVTQNVIRRHGGRIHVASAQGNGTTFRVEIPMLAERPW